MDEAIEDVEGRNIEECTNIRTVSIFGHFSQIKRGILVTICDDKIVLEVYFMEAYCRNFVHFSGALANTNCGIFG